MMKDLAMTAALPPYEDIVASELIKNYFGSECPSYIGSIIKSKGIMIKIIIPSIVVEQALLMKLPVLGPSILLVLSKVAYFFSGFVNLPLKVSYSGHLLLLLLYLLMKHLHVSDFLVQLVLLGSWTSGLTLLASGLSKRKGLLIWVQWLQSGSPCR
jgi:hypothetical protein